MINNPFSLQDLVSYLLIKHKPIKFQKEYR